MLPEKGRSQNGDILGVSDGVAAGQSVRAMARPIRIQLLRPVFSPYFLPLCHPKLSAQLPRSHRVTRAALSTCGRPKANSIYQFKWRTWLVGSGVKAALLADSLQKLSGWGLSLCNGKCRGEGLDIERISAACASSGRAK